MMTGSCEATELHRSCKRKRTTSVGDNVSDESASQVTTTNPDGGDLLSHAGSTGLSDYNPKVKNPRVHYNAAVACMAHRAALTGHTTDLVRRLCTASRSACDSLAAYQQLLTDTRRRLASLGADPGETFAVWVAIAGLKDVHRRWYCKLVVELAAGRLDWDTLMAAMAKRACREKQKGE